MVLNGGLCGTRIPSHVFRTLLNTTFEHFSDVKQKVRSRSEGKVKVPFPQEKKLELFLSSLYSMFRFIYRSNE